MATSTAARTITARRVSVATLATAAAVAGAVALPQVFHLAGAALGLGTGLGESFLPMHLPVLLVGFLAGPFVGAVSGLLAPIVSNLMTNMPGAAMLPLMVIELGVYGLVAGLLKNRTMNVFAKLVVAQLAGRAARAVALLVSFYALGNQAVAVSSIWMSVVTGIPGLILQWAFVPAVLFAVKRATKAEQER